jgi:hypothetical protein
VSCAPPLGAHGLPLPERAPQGSSAALVFSARIGDKDIDGIDLLEVDAEGLVTQLSVFVRPLSGLLALVEAMRQALSAVD